MKFNLVCKFSERYVIKDGLKACHIGWLLSLSVLCHSILDTGRAAPANPLLPPGGRRQLPQFTIFNYHVYRHGVYGVYIDIIILKVITIRHERITTRHK